MAGASVDVQSLLQGPLKVDDVMTKKTLFSVREDTSIDEGRGAFLQFSSLCAACKAEKHLLVPTLCTLVPVALSGLKCCRELLTWEVDLFTMISSAQNTVVHMNHTETDAC